MSTTLPNLAPQLLRSRLSKVCVAITGATAAEMIEKATVALKEFTFLEFRLDYLDKPLAALPKFQRFFAENMAATAIATCRRQANGGRFTGSAAQQVEILAKAAETGFYLADIEIETAESMKRAGVDKLRGTGIALIISHHDFQATKDLDGIFARIDKFGPDFVKIVPTAKSLSDNVALIRFLERMAERGNVIGICMGDAGIISRVLGLRAGSAFTFAAATQGEETGPGQIAARTLVETYRIDQVDVATKVYGVAGNPIRSSLSPIMMNTAFRRETVNAVYLALQTSRVNDLVKLIHEIPLQGVSITMPLKEDILPHLEQTDALSAKIGAVNTLRLLDGKLFGFNTDVAGIIGPLEKRLPLRGARVLVLGAGGAARAAVFGVRDRGADVYILNRTSETAQKLARQSGSHVLRRDALGKTQFDVIINATPVGMAGNKAPQLLEPEHLKTRLVFDLVYNPLETPLIRMARQLQIPIITGVEMFVQQGARQFEIFTGKPAPEEEMFRVVLHALRQHSEQVAAEPEQPAANSAKAVKPAAAKAAPAPAPAKAASRSASSHTNNGASKPPAKAGTKPAAKPTKKTPPKPAKKTVPKKR